MDLAEKIYNALSEARKQGPLPREKWLDVARAAIDKAKREFKRAAVAEEAEAIYEAYPRKAAKLDALVAITKALRNSDMSPHGMRVATKA